MEVPGQGVDGVRQNEITGSDLRICSRNATVGFRKKEQESELILKKWHKIYRQSLT